MTGMVRWTGLVRRLVPQPDAEARAGVGLGRYWLPRRHLPAQTRRRRLRSRNAADGRTAPLESSHRTRRRRQGAALGQSFRFSFLIFCR